MGLHCGLSSYSACSGCINLQYMMPDHAMCQSATFGQSQDFALEEQQVSGRPGDIFHQNDNLPTTVDDCLNVCQWQQCSLLHMQLGELCQSPLCPSPDHLGKWPFQKGRGNGLMPRATCSRQKSTKDRTVQLNRTFCGTKTRQQLAQR